MELLGLHHVTAVTARAADNVRFYTDTLGLRLVKKTVNQDDVSAYHLFYGDATGRPGTEVTFFDWAASPDRQAGIDEIAQIALRVPSADALRWWSERLDAAGVGRGGIVPVAGRATLAFTDPEGQRLALVDASGDPPGGTAEPWTASPVSAEVAIRGLGPITLVVGDAAPTTAVLTDGMGFRLVGRDGARQVFATAGGGSGAEVHLVEQTGARAHPGSGGVHHVAFRTPTADAQREWRERLSELGVPTSRVIDRYYFQSLYFREPNGILFEIATDGPGFTVDEDAARLGQRLSLPPFLERRRAEIEAGLLPLGPVTVGAVPVAAQP